MNTYLSLLRRHGLKLSWNYLLGRITIHLIAVIILLLWIAAIFALGLVIGGVSTVNADNPLDSFLAQGVISVVIILTSAPAIIFYSFSTEAFTLSGLYGSIKELLAGGKARLRTFFSFGWRYLWKMTGQFLLFLLLLSFSLIIPVGLIILLIATESILGVLLAFLIGLVTFVWICYYLIVFIHAPIVMVYEEVGAFRSVPLTFRVIRKAFGEAIITVLSLFLIIFISYILLIIPMMFAGLLAGAMEASTGEAEIVIILIVIPFLLLLFLLIIAISVLFTVAMHLCLIYRYVNHLRPKALG